MISPSPLVLYLRGPGFEYHPRHRILGQCTFNLVTMTLYTSVPTYKCLENTLYQATTGSFHFCSSSLLMNPSAVRLMTVQRFVCVRVPSCLCMYACVREKWTEAWVCVWRSICVPETRGKKYELRLFELYTAWYLSFQLRALCYFVRF
jgi:hypothetical protein